MIQGGAKLYKEDIDRGIRYYKDTRFWECHLADGKPYLLEPYCILRTVKDACEEDWKTAVARSIPNIPAGTEVEFLEVLQNFYGNFLQVRYLGRTYSIKFNTVEYVRRNPEKLERKEQLW